MAPDAERIVVLLVLTGGGRAWIDDVSLAAVPAGDADGGAALLVNAGFEDGETGRQPPGWYFPYEAVRSGYHLLLRRGEPCRHGGCAEVASDDIATPFIRPPADALEVSLPGGAAAAVPLSLWADAAGTLPHPAPGAPAGAWAGVDPSADTRAARLATVALVWGIQQHFHPELDPASPDWIAALPAALDGAARAPDREAFRRVLRRLLVPLGDVRTLGVFHRGDPATGLPPIAWAWVEDRLVVTGAAADAGGLRPGDVIATIDGRPAAEALADAESLASGPLPATRRWRALELLAEGQAGSRLVLGAERAGGAPFTVSLTRAAAAQPVPDTPLPTVAEPRPGIVYADLRRMADADLDSLLPRLAAAKGIVFDLRGETDVSTVLLSHLAERTAMSSNWQVPVVMLPDHHDVKWLTTFWTIEPKAPRLRGKVAFLTDGRAIGYSETLLGMIERYRWAELVGEPSGADNGSLNWSDLPGGWRVTWSGQRVLKHDGSPFHGVGELPTVPATRTLRGIAPAATRSSSAPSRSWQAADRLLPARRRTQGKPFSPCPMRRRTCPMSRRTGGKSLSPCPMRRRTCPVSRWTCPMSCRTGGKSLSLCPMRRRTCPVSRRTCPMNRRTEGKSLSPCPMRRRACPVSRWTYPMSRRIGGQSLSLRPFKHRVGRLKRRAGPGRRRSRPGSRRARSGGYRTPGVRSLKPCSCGRRSSEPELGCPGDESS